MQDYQKRIIEWCNATGLKKSKASYKKAFGWQNKFISPSGFDHTQIFYHPEKKVHLVITEPYEYTSFAASFRVWKCLFGMNVSIIACKRGAGLWNPPHCIPVLIGKEKDMDFLIDIAKHLPEYSSDLTKDE